MRFAGAIERSDAHVNEQNFGMVTKEIPSWECSECYALYAKSDLS